MSPKNLLSVCGRTQIFTSASSPEGKQAMNESPQPVCRNLLSHILVYGWREAMIPDVFELERMCKLLTVGGCAHFSLLPGFVHRTGSV